MTATASTTPSAPSRAVRRVELSRAATEGERVPRSPVISDCPLPYGRGSDHGGVTGAGDRPLRRRFHAHRARRCAYILLETVIASGLLVVGMAVIGAQLQDSDMAIRKMERRVRGMILAQQQLSFLDLGLIKLDSLDEVEEGDFGPREPDWGWRMVTEPIAVEGMFRLTLEVMHNYREGDYRKDTFEHDDAEVVYFVYLFRATPQTLDLAADFGLTDEELEVVSDKLAASGLPGFNALAFDPAALAKLEPEELLEALPIILDVLGIDLGELSALIPPDILRDLQESGLLGGLADDQEQGGGS